MRNFSSSGQVMFYLLYETTTPFHFFCCERRDLLLCNYGNGDLFTCDDTINASFSVFTYGRYRGARSIQQNSNRSDREKRSTSKGGPVFSKLFRLDRTDPLSFGPKCPEILVEWIAPHSFARKLTWYFIGVM